MFLRRPAVDRATGSPGADRRSNTTAGDVALLFVALLVSALATEAIGIHALFGAFLLGAIVPHDSAWPATLTRQLGRPGRRSAAAGVLRVHRHAHARSAWCRGSTSWLICGLIILVATVGKFGGDVRRRASDRPARGARRRRSASLMNTRGLMELIVLNVGLDLGVISPALFAMMVLMALVTTLATGPLLKLTAPRRA